MRISRLISTAATAAFAMTSAHAAYTITVDPSASSPPVFSLTLPADHGKVLETRAQPSEVKQPYCDALPLKQIGPGRWELPSLCRRVEWSINFVAPPDSDASQTVALHSVAFRGWWSVMEQNALLRVAGDPTASELTIKTPGHADRKAYVPPVDDAPEIYVLGNVRETVRMVNGVRVRYVSDDLPRVTQRGFLNDHAEALRSLQRLFPANPTVPFADELLVVIVGNRSETGLSGAGGARSLVFDYQRDTNKRDIFVLLALSHEQFHQLRSLHGNGAFIGDAWSPWLEEGLAHYYGLKTVQSSQLPADDKTKVWNVFINPQRPVSAGLAELNRRFKRGDQSVYPLFYQQGATFFAELDRALQKASGGTKSLDDYAASLKTTPAGTLPASLIAQWRAIAGQRIDSLLARYVGS